MMLLKMASTSQVMKSQALLSHLQEIEMIPIIMLKKILTTMPDQSNIRRIMIISQITIALDSQDLTHSKQIICY